MNVAAAVVTSSDSVALGRYPDESGAIAAAGLADLGFEVAGPVAVPDDADRIRAAVDDAIGGGARVVVINGGTGLGPRDVTVAVVEQMGGRLLPGIGEALRADARSRVPSTDLSRAGAYQVGRSLVLCLPGSPGAVRAGMRVAGGLLRHAVAMLDGGGHGHRHGPTLGSPTSRALVTPDPIDLPSLVASVADHGAGAVITFEGRVRNSDRGRAVVSLTYEAHPDAEQVLIGILARVLERDRVLGAAAAHRVGDLGIGDLAFAAVVATPHRQAGFEALSWLVDEVKQALPVWKRQVFADGSHEWVNCA
jgi:molybdenum cofactor synthesis domain-containing protein